jgi:hypothetical protein
MPLLIVNTRPPSKAEVERPIESHARTGRMHNGPEAQ